MTDDIHRAVQALLDARRSRRPLPASAVTLRGPDDAYAVQEAVARELGWIDSGAPAHWKSGAAPAPLMRTHAPLPPAGVHASPAGLAGVPFFMRGIEAEIALRLGRDVDAALAATLDDAAAAALVDAMTVAIEVVDSRWAEGTAAPPLHGLADLQSHGALVLGEWVPFAPRDWPQQVVRVQVGAQAPVERLGSHALGDPARLLAAWLRHATRDGRVLPAGSVVTTGSWVGILKAAAGDRVVAEFPGVGVASVRL